MTYYVLSTYYGPEIYFTEQETGTQRSELFKLTQLLRVRPEIQARWCLVQKLKHLFSALDGLPDQGPHALQGSSWVSGTAHLGHLTSFSGRWGTSWPLAGWFRWEWFCLYPRHTVTQLLKVGDETLRSDPWENLSGTPLADAHPRKCSPTDGRASRNSVRRRGGQQEAPASPANDKLFHPQQSPGTGVRSDTKKPSFILAARLPSKEKTSQDNRFLWGEHKAWTGGFPLKSITHNFLSRLQAAWSDPERKRNAGSKYRDFLKGKCTFGVVRHFILIDKGNFLEKSKW